MKNIYFEIQSVLYQITGKATQFLCKQNVMFLDLKL